MSIEDEIVRNLKKQKGLISRTITQGLDEIGLKGVKNLKQNTPTITGRLKNSMSYSIENKVVNPDTPDEKNDEVKSNPSKKEVIIGTNVVYAAWVEFMSKTGSAGYMIRSYNQTKKQANRIMERIFKQKGY